MKDRGKWMIGDYQGTIKQKIKFAGVGLHSGELVNLEVKPAGPNTGIVFQRIDNENACLISAHPYNVSSTALCTSIGTNKDQVSTIEHLMAAFYGLGIDNAVVLVDSNEIPILDGSAAPFVDKLKAVGIEVQACFRKVFVVKKSFEVRDGDQFIRVEPSDCLEFSCTIDFECSEAIGKQSFKMKFGPESFLELCEARTFCHIDDVKSMRAAGLALGGSLDNAIVVNDESVVNADGLRYPDEFVRHKLLDCMGDLGLLGGKLLAKVTTYKSGHALHAKFTAAFLGQGSKLFETHDRGLKKSARDVGRENGLVGLGMVANQVAVT